METRTNIYVIFKFTKRPKTLEIISKKYNDFAGDFHVGLDETNADMLQFTKKWNWNWIVYHQGYFSRKPPGTNVSFAMMYVPCLRKIKLSSLSDGWVKI